jgi:hypothetical protein
MPRKIKAPAPKTAQQIFDAQQASIVTNALDVLCLNHIARGAALLQHKTKMLSTADVIEIVFIYLSAQQLAGRLLRILERVSAAPK